MGQPRRKEPQRWEKPRGGGGSPLSIIQRECWRWIAGEAPGGGAPGALGAVEPASERSPGALARSPDPLEAEQGGTRGRLMEGPTPATASESSHPWIPAHRSA
jgi:hypothetical protein